ncbi:CapA family protein, partial [Eubacteriales bacterium OttesenSCG-928-N13]|nr:CapA family protein [Eubacteriales bacterium OttesenSCG-928-N13]
MKRNIVKVGMLMLLVMALLLSSLAITGLDQDAQAATKKLKQLKFKASTVYLAPGGSYQLKPVFVPSNATYRTIDEWGIVQSTLIGNTDDAISIDSNGLLKAKADAQVGARIRVYAKSGTKYAYAWVTVKVSKVSSITLKRKSYKTSLKYADRIGETKKLDMAYGMKLIPYYAANQEILWESTKPDVASVDQNGMVTMLNEGTTYIYARATDESNKYARCKVTVTAYRAKSITVKNGGLITLDANQVIGDAIGATVSPDTATYPAVTYTTRDTNVCTVDSDGKITAGAKGVTYIDMTTDNGRIKKSFKVQVRTANAPSFSMSAVGDIVMGDDPRRTSNFYKWLKKHTADGNSIFKEAKPFFDNTDITIANLESPLTSRSMQKKGLGFRGKKSNATLIKDGGITHVNIANNHIRDCGGGGYSDTKSALRSSGVTYNGFNYSEKKIVEINGIRVGLIGFQTGSYGATSASIKRDIGKMKSKDGCEVVIASIHFCEVPMYTYKVRSKQKSEARAAISAGADVVLGTHPTYTSGIEYYKGKYINYCQGTFVSAGKTAVGSRKTYIMQQRFVVHEGFVEAQGFTIIPFWNSPDKKENQVFPTYLTNQADIDAVVAQVRKYSP